MAKVCIVIPQSDLTVTNSIARNVVKDLIEYTGFPKDAEIIIDSKQGGTRALSGFTNQCEIPIRTEQRNYVFVTITERYTEEGVNLHRQPGEMRRKAFDDADLGVSLDPIYTQAEIELAIRFKTRDLTTMRNWVSGMRVNAGFETNSYHHAIKYDYALPNQIINFIVEAYNMSERVAPRGKTLKEFIQEGFNDSLIKRKNLSGEHSEFVVNEIQTGVAGLKLNDHPYNEYTVEEDGVYELNYPYKIVFDRIDAITLTSPIIIHNQLVPEKFLRNWLTRQNPQYQPFGFKEDGWIVDTLEDDKFDMFFKGDGGSRMIPYDDYFPKFPRKNTATIFLAPIQVDETDLNKALSLSDLDTTYVPKCIKDYLLRFHERNATFRAGLVSVEVYENFAEERRLAVVMDANGVVRTQAPMLLNRRNYVKIDLIKDFSVFNTAHTIELLEEGTILQGLCSLLDPSLVFENKPGKNTIRKNIDGSLNPSDYTAWLKKLKSVNETFRTYKGKSIKTVLVAGVITRRTIHDFV